MSESPTRSSGLAHSTEFPSSMLTDKEKLEDVKQKLYKAIQETYPDSNRSCPSFEGKDKREAMKQMIDCNEVYPGIILGDETTARNLAYLKKIGITHLVNACCGSSFGRKTEKIYQPKNIKFLGLQINDYPTEKISIYFKKSSEFIDNALASKGKVFVHCVMGVSRSSTIVIAFLMIKRGYTAENALRLVRSKRFVLPNDGFLEQLAALDLRLADRRSLESDESYVENEKNKTEKPCLLS